MYDDAELAEAERVDEAEQIRAAAVVDDVGSLVVVTRRALSTAPAGTSGADRDAYELGVYRRSFESLELLIGNHDPIYRV